jgi:hypothetical protein
MVREIYFYFYFFFFNAFYCIYTNLALFLIFSDPAKQTMRSVSIHLVCDNSLAPSASVFKDVKKEATCNTEYIFHSKFACPTSAAANGPKHFLMMGMIGFILYFLIGGLICKYHYQQEGEDIIPNIQFWKDLPAVTSDGCAYTVEKIKSLKQDGFGGIGGVFGSGGDDSSSSSSSSSSNDAPSPSTYGSGSTPADDYA